MAVQREVSEALMAGKVGSLVDVLVDEVDEEGAIGRTIWDAPEIDGSVFLNGETSLKPGDMLKVRITNADAYDLWAEPVPGPH